MGRLKQLPPRVAPAPYSLRLAPDRSPAEHRDTAPWRRWYGLARWKRLRIETFAKDHFTCQMCGKLQGDTSKLTCDHIRPHRGNPSLFWDATNLQTLCSDPCHAKHKQAQEQDSLHHRGVWD